MMISPPIGYTLQGVLGSGASATVYLAHHRSLNRLVALKRVPETSLSETDSRSLITEGRVLASVSSVHVARVFDVAVGGGAVWLVMEYVPGHSLQEVLDSSTAVGVDRATNWAAQIADALAGLSKAGIIHKDLKPANVIVTESNECRVVDFGLAWSPYSRVSGGGTPAYMSPEQANGQDVTPKSDVYSLGLLSHHMLTGYHPFPHAVGNPTAMMQAQIGTRPPRVRTLVPEVSQQVSRTIAAALRKSPARRPSASGLRRRLVAELR
jgi:serine/threonine protein kinase